MASRWREDLREAIIKTSLELGSELGADGLTMRGIASRLGVSATALYQHFDSKASILREIRLFGVDGMAAALKPAAEIADPLERTAEMAVRYVKFARANPWLYSVLMEQERVDWADLSPDENARMVGPIRLVREGLRDAVAKGKLRDSLDVDNASLQLWAAIHGVSSLMLTDRISVEHPGFPIKDDDEFLRGYVDGIIQGFIG